MIRIERNIKGQERKIIETSIELVGKTYQFKNPITLTPGDQVTVTTKFTYEQ